MIVLKEEFTPASSSSKMPPSNNELFKRKSLPYEQNVLLIDENPN